MGEWHAGASHSPQGPPRRTLHSGLRPTGQAAQGPGLSTAGLRAKLQTSSFTSRNLFPRSPGGGTAKVKVRTGLLLPRPLSLAAGGCPFSVSSGPFPGRVCVPTSWMRTSAGWDQGHPCFAFVPSARPCAQVQPYGGGLRAPTSDLGGHRSAHTPGSKLLGGQEEEATSQRPGAHQPGRCEAEAGPGSLLEGFPGGVRLAEPWRVSWGQLAGGVEGAQERVPPQLHGAGRLRTGWPSGSEQAHRPPPPPPARALKGRKMGASGHFAQ